MSKWYFKQDCHCKRLTITAMYFRRLPNIMTIDKEVTVLFAKIKELKKN